jgi:hypothetical protein
MKSALFSIFILFALNVFSQSSDKSYVTNLEYLKISNGAIESFKKNFAGAEDPRWNVTNEGSTVKFKQDNVNYHVFYSRRGKWQATIQCLPLEMLPRWVVARVKSDFKNFAIFFAQHIRTPIGHTYIINIEKGNNWKCIRISSEATEVLGEYVRN